MNCQIIHPDIVKMMDTYGVTSDTRKFLDQAHQMFINGDFVQSKSGDRIKVIEPSTEQVLTDIPAGNVTDVDAAVIAAREAFDGEWSEIKPMEREQLIRHIADSLEQHAQTIAEIESIDNGKSVTDALSIDVAGSVRLLRYMAGWSSKIEGATRQVSTPGDHFVCTRKEPVGVVGGIVPWNWPLSMSIWKIAAPLAAGCTLVIKPSEQTALSLLYFAELCQQAGLPRGVLNIVTGTGAQAGQALAEHPGINKLSFTGSTHVGKLVGQAALQNLNHVTLELGGKSPMVAFADADINKLAQTTRWSIFLNAGQVCSGGSRLYVHESIYEQTLDAIAKVAAEIKVAPGLDRDSDMGPVISAQQYASICSYLEIGKEEGARVVCGGEPTDRPGYFIPPTVLADTRNDMRIVQEEIFGPVLVVQSFSDEQEAIELANDNIYGLAASIWTQDISKALKATEKLDAGTVWVNTHDLVDVSVPFGGLKQSGIGKDMGPEQLSHYLETKAVWVSL